MVHRSGFLLLTMKITEMKIVSFCTLSLRERVRVRDGITTCAALFPHPDPFPGDGGVIKKVILFASLWAALSVNVDARAQVQAPVIEPQIDRREVRVPKIRAHDIEIGVYGGMLSVEDFGANSSKGV